MILLKLKNGEIRIGGTGRVTTATVKDTDGVEKELRVFRYQATKGANLDIYKVSDIEFLNVDGIKVELEEKKTGKKTEE